MRSLRRGAGDPSFLPPPPRARAPRLPPRASPCVPAAARAPAPGSQFPSDGFAAVQSPDSCAVSWDQGRAASEGRTHSFSRAAPRRSLAVPHPLPGRERDVDRRRVDPGEAPKLEPVYWRRHCPLPLAQRSEEHPLALAPLPAPSAEKGRHDAAGGAGDGPPLVLG